MKLALNKPIVFFDLETTGTNVTKDRIVEISILKLHPDGKEEVKTRRINPEIPIPKETSEIHGIYDKDVAEEPTFKAIAKSLVDFIDNSDLAGYNSNKFDVPLLVEELIRVDVEFDLEKRKLIDVQNIFHKIEPRSLVAAYKFYCGQDLVDAHSAEADVKATYEVLEAILERTKKINEEVELLSSLKDKIDVEADKQRLQVIIDEKKSSVKGYESIDNTSDFLSAFSKRNNAVDLIGRIVYNADEVEVFNFGKYRGQSVESVLKNDPGYYSWIMKGDFPSYTKKVLTSIKLKSAFSN